jgi:hypothetical protein
MDDKHRALVADIHAAPPRIVYAFAGAGSLALWWLHRVAGSSRTLLEAIDCYAPHSLEALLGAPPAQAVSGPTARAMADRAYARAALLSAGGWPLLGVGCTAAIATDRERRGADRCALAICGAEGVRSYMLTISKARGREGQEELIAQLVIGAIAVACGLGEGIALDLMPDEELS